MINNFTAKEDVFPEDDIVQLQPLTASHFNDLLPFALKEPELWKYSLFSAAGEQGLKDYFEAALAGRASGTEYPFAVFDKRISQYAGCTRFYDIQPRNASLQLGYTWYGKSFQGTGLNKHCKMLLLELAFDKWNMQRVEFRADNNNARSIAAMKSIGCTAEGVLRSHVATHNGTRRDSIVLSILKSEWEGHVKNDLRKIMK